MKDILGSILGIIMIFIMLGVTPLYYIGLLQWSQAETQALAYTTNLVDEVIDTKQLTDDALEDYTLQMAALDSRYTFTIEKQVKVVNPDPMNEGALYTTYVVDENNRSYASGDLIVVKVEPKGFTVAQSIAKGALGLMIPNKGFTIPGRVR